MAANMKYPRSEMSTFHVMGKTSEVTVFLSVFFGSILHHPASKIYNFGERVSFRVRFSRDFSRLPPKGELARRLPQDFH